MTEGMVYGYLVRCDGLEKPGMYATRCPVCNSEMIGVGESHSPTADMHLCLNCMQGYASVMIPERWIREYHPKTIEDIAELKKRFPMEYTFGEEYVGR